MKINKKIKLIYDNLPADKRLGQGEYANLLGLSRYQFNRRINCIADWSIEELLSLTSHWGLDLSIIDSIESKKQLISLAQGGPMSLSLPTIEKMLDNMKETVQKEEKVPENHKSALKLQIEALRESFKNTLKN